MNGRGSGDLVARIAIEVPVHLSSRQRRALEEFAAASDESSYPDARGFRQNAAAFMARRDAIREAAK